MEVPSEAGLLLELLGGAEELELAGGAGRGRACWTVKALHQIKCRNNGWG